MWVWSPNWGEIRYDLVIGSCPILPADIDRICDDTRVSAVLSVQTDQCRAALGIEWTLLEEHASRRGVVLDNVPIRDFDPEDQRNRLPQAIRRLSELLGEGYRTYVHCTAGINRAPLVVLGYLTFVEGMAVPDALSLIQQGRREASPYWDAYRGCREDVLGQYHDEVLHGPTAEQEILRRVCAGLPLEPERR